MKIRDVIIGFLLVYSLLLTFWLCQVSDLAIRNTQNIHNLVQSFKR